MGKQDGGLGGEQSEGAALTRQTWPEAHMCSEDQSSSWGSKAAKRQEWGWSASELGLTAAGERVPDASCNADHTTYSNVIPHFKCDDDDPQPLSVFYIL